MPEQEVKKRKAEDAAEHKGYGKLILFGEHFVVYKKPALVGAVKAATVAEVELSDENTWSRGLIVEDARPAIPGYKDKKAGEMIESTRLVLKHFDLDSDKRGVKVILKGDLAPVSGIGASAANCVSVARALAAALGKDVDEDEINQAAYEGIDNTASTFGGVLRFQRTDGKPLFDKKKLPVEIPIVYASTGITASTTEVVGDVREKREKDAAWYEGLEKEYMEVFDAAEKAIEEGGEGLVKTFAELANRNHEILQKLSVSCKELDDLVETAKSAGALGAKMSGTGRGGLMFAICADEASQEAVAKALEGKAPQVWKTAFQ
ncbi:Mevalonate kinase [Hondaea fermentalgiana]|uniref:Mevalonate kinase n=1 Tax=Hondaea fermentalgiana TaxID=2315210 RepID=A0A2R5GZ03_9STRA|nr:Mevalonate kinase [Hondaea fermentalgiana]|eukprot:GBG33701.1 Mevalonate kinase [Hondaea fermentalgiana]